MSGLTIIPSISSAALADIEIADRLRPVSEATVAALDVVIGEFGFTVPVLVRKMKSGFRLIDGAHRLAVMKRRGAAAIPVVAVSCTDQEAQVLEGSQNLAGASMSPLDEAIFMAAFADAYQALHPETKRGAAGALARHGLANELSSFADVIGEKRSISVRQVQKIAKAGRMIGRAEAQQLRGAKRKLTLKDIQDLGSIADDRERGDVILRLASGNAKSAAEARRTLKAENQGVQSTVKDPVEEAFKALTKLWSRTPKEAKRRFSEAHADEIGIFLADMDQADVDRMAAEADAA